MELSNRNDNSFLHSLRAQNHYSPVRASFCMQDESVHVCPVCSVRALSQVAEARHLAACRQCGYACMRELPAIVAAASSSLATSSKGSSSATDGLDMQRRDSSFAFVCDCGVPATILSGFRHTSAWFGKRVYVCGLSDGGRRRGGSASVSSGRGDNSSGGRSHDVAAAATASTTSGKLPAASTTTVTSKLKASTQSIQSLIAASKNASAPSRGCRLWLPVEESDGVANRMTRLRLRAMATSTFATNSAITANDIRQLLHVTRQEQQRLYTTPRHLAEYAKGALLRLEASQLACILGLKPDVDASDILTYVVYGFSFSRSGVRIPTCGIQGDPSMLDYILSQFYAVFNGMLHEAAASASFSCPSAHLMHKRLLEPWLMGVPHNLPAPSRRTTDTSEEEAEEEDDFTGMPAYTPPLVELTRPGLMVPQKMPWLCSSAAAILKFREPSKANFSKSVVLVRMVRRGAALTVERASGDEDAWMPSCARRCDYVEAVASMAAHQANYCHLVVSDGVALRVAVFAWDARAQQHWATHILPKCQGFYDDEVIPCVLRGLEQLQPSAAARWGVLGSSYLTSSSPSTYASLWEDLQASTAQSVASQSAAAAASLQPPVRASIELAQQAAPSSSSHPLPATSRTSQLANAAEEEHPMPRSVPYEERTFQEEEDDDEYVASAKKPVPHSSSSLSVGVAESRHSAESRRPIEPPQPIHDDDESYGWTRH